MPLSDEEKAAVLEFANATTSLHTMHGSTAVHGGAGGQMITAHCGWSCDHRSHDAEEARWSKAYHTLFELGIIP